MTPEEIEADAAAHAALLDRVRDASRRYSAVSADAVSPKPYAPSEIVHEPSRFTSREEECLEKIWTRRVSRMNREMLSSFKPPSYEAQ